MELSLLQLLKKRNMHEKSIILKFQINKVIPLFLLFSLLKLMFISLVFIDILIK